MQRIQAHKCRANRTASNNRGGDDSYLENAAGDFQDGHIEGASSQVIDCNDLAVSLVHAVSKCGCRGLVDDAADLEASNSASIL